MNDDNDKIYNINLGGFPPIIKVNNSIKKKREFSKEVIKINTSISDKINILNINNFIKLK
jgi:hypothetical protein